MRFGQRFLSDAPQPEERLYPLCVTEESPVPFPEESEYGILIDDAFACWPQTNRGLLISGWNFAGNIRCAADPPKGMFLFQTGDGAGCRARRSIPVVTRQMLTVELLYLCSSPTLADADIHLYDAAQQKVLTVTQRGGSFVLRVGAATADTGVSFAAGRLYGIRLTVDPVKKHVVLQIDSKTAAELTTGTAPIAGFGIQTGDRGNGYVQLVYCSAHAGYPVRERFFTALDGCIPDDWAFRGKAELTELPVERNADVLSLRLFPGAVLEKAVNTPPASFTLSFSLYAEADCTLSCSLTGEAHGVSVGLRDGAFSLMLDGGEYIALYPYRTGVWFVVALSCDDRTHTAVLWVNHKPVAALPLPLLPPLSCLRIACGQGAPLVDDIILAPLPPQPVDYVPAPQRADTGDTLIGMLSCDLWHEGSHLGWDRINDFDGGGRKPLLGWYEDGSPEAADWEIRFLTEHGVSFRMPCWYRPRDTVGCPFKTPLHSEGLHDGYFHARYSQQLKFAVFLTVSPGEIAGYADFCDHVLPYLEEYYLKDPRYMTIDNQPLIGVYSYPVLREAMGGEEAVCAAMERVREVCRGLGYDGALFITSLFGLQSAENAEIEAGGSDLACAYGWGIPFSDSGNGQAAILQYTKTHDGVNKLVASVTTGFDFYPWEGSNASQTVTPGEFARLCRFVRDRYLPAFPEDSLLSRLVILDNWNEYAEGHAMCPSAEYGFTWLDTVRETFALSAPHTDLRPTPRQQARMGLLYPPTRRLKHPLRYPAVPEIAACTQAVWTLTPQTASAAAIRAVTEGERCGGVALYPDGWHIACAGAQRLAVVEITPAVSVRRVPPYAEVLISGDARTCTGRMYFAVDGEDIDYVYQTRKMVPVSCDGDGTRFLCDLGRAVKPDGGIPGGVLTKLQIWFFPDGREVRLCGVWLKDTPAAAP